MSLKRYFLTVDLEIDGKLTTVTLANYDLVALEKYTSFCSGPEDLLKYMPNDNSRSIRNYISKHIKKPINEDNDPFSIRTSESKNARKIRIIYNRDLDVLLAGQKALHLKINKNYGATIDDFINGNISLEKQETLKTMYDKFAGRNFNNAVSYLIEKRLNMDGEYDEKYLTPCKNRWMFIAISQSCMKALVKDAFKDDRKRIELAFLIKDNTGDLLPDMNYSDKERFLGNLESRLMSRKASPHFIRKSIRRNVEPLIINELEVKQEMKKKKVNFSAITEEEIINYNKQRNGSGTLGEIISLSEEILNLNLSLEVLLNKTKDIEDLFKTGSFLESDESIKKRLEFSKTQVNNLKKKIAQLEYELNELESGNATYSDAGFVIEKDKDM